MKVLVIMGSPRKKDGYQVCQMIEEKLNGLQKVEFEYVNVNKLQIGECKGCEQCLLKGEGSCPLKDDAELLRKKMQEADGILFNSPVYACHVTASLKKVIDRFSYLFHRPELIGKPAITVVTTAGGGAKVTTKYLKMTAIGWGCQCVGNIEVVGPMMFEGRWGGQYANEKYKTKKDKQIDQVTHEFYRALTQEQLPKPSFYEIYMFNGLKSKTITSKADYAYWESKGWLKSEYYYKTDIGLVKRLFGWSLSQIIESVSGRMLKGEA